MIKKLRYIDFIDKPIDRDDFFSLISKINEIISEMHKSDEASKQCMGDPEDAWICPTHRV